MEIVWDMWKINLFCDNEVEMNVDSNKPKAWKKMTEAAQLVWRPQYCACGMQRRAH
mgnify:CR=1 FL=1